MRVGKGKLQAFKATCKASPRSSLKVSSSGSSLKVASSECIVSENDITSRFHDQILPKMMRMTTIKRIVPNPPLGKYPQSLLCGHRGHAPRNARRRTTINIVPSIFTPRFPATRRDCLKSAAAPCRGRSGYTALSAQTSSRCIGWAADCVAGYNQFDSAVLLSAR